MQTTKPLLFLAFSILLFNCSDDDSNASDSGEEQTQFVGDFLPLTLNNQWNYDVENTDNDTNEVTLSEDVLVIESETATGFSLTVNQGTIANGVMSGILTSGDLSLTETTLVSNGTIGLPIDIIDLNIELNNALLYNTEASVNTELYSLSDTFTQDLQGFPISINYTLTTTQLENIESMVVNDMTYNLVTSANISLELSISTEILIPIVNITQTFSILDQQSVLSVDSFYAKNIGLIKAEADSGFTLSNQVQQLPIDLSMIPTSVSNTNTQELTSYILQ
ncbi:MAG: hypothetical protein WBF67_02655 [Olleya sp.]